MGDLKVSWNFVGIVPDLKEANSTDDGSTENAELWAHFSSHGNNNVS